MSLLNKNSAFNVRDYLFAAAGLLFLFWFFLSYSSQDPRSAIQLELKQNTAINNALKYFHELDYSQKSINTTATLESHANLLDSLQHQMGRQKVIQALTDSTIRNLYPYYWNIQIMIPDDDGDDGSLSHTTDEIVVNLNEKGELIEFINSQNLMPSQVINKEALIAAFDTDPNLKLWRSLPDSSWNRILQFDMQREYSGESTDVDSLEQTGEGAHTYTRDNIRRLAEFHLRDTGWQLSNLELSDIRIFTIRSNTAAEVVYNSVEPTMGQNVRLEITLLPTGSMLNLDAEYNPQSVSNEIPSVLSFVRGGLIFIFAFVIIILFYFRIRARAIDTTPALIVGILGGLMIPILIFLQEWQSMPLFSEGVGTTDLLGLALSMGFAGALSSIAFFAVFAVGDSLMRQHWPGKLYCYDYLRQGMFFNKPVGETIIRSITLSFILCGLWSTVLYLFPDLYFNVNSTFLDHNAAWSPIHLLLDSAWFSLILVTSIFAVVGTQVFGMYKNQKLAGTIIVVILGIMTPFMQAFDPPLLDIAVSGILALFLTYIFLKWDLVTTFLTHFFFILMFKASTGWIVEGSPDLYIFIFLGIFLLFNIIAGILFITKGKEQQSLPGFVPEYVEELAQEERIKQELQIAREVQQSFLPVAMPEFETLDVAAICKPAYETGGDYYDFVRLDDHRIAVTIGDVSGKGIQAAFYMTFIKGILHSLCREVDSPAEILKKTNRLFFDNAPRGTFISLVYGVIDTRENIFHFARAGHNPILKRDAEENTIKEFRPQGIGIGLIKGPSFDNNIEEMQLSMRGEDILVLYTDGIVEALNEQHEFFGSKRLNDLIEKYEHNPADEMLKSITKDLSEYIGEAKQHDDMTMIIIKLKSGS